MLVMEHGNNLKWLFQVMGSSGASFEFGPICLILCVCVCVRVCTHCNASVVHFFVIWIAVLLLVLWRKTRLVL